MEKEGNMITDWLDQYGNPEIEKFIEKNLAITEKVRLAMENKGWKSQDLAKAMNKNPSEVSKWLTGMHNLTLKSIIKMEVALGIDLMHTEPVKEYEYVYLGSIQNQKDLLLKANDYEATTEQLQYDIAV
jgi:ribosome-binding protein aMBF1 (putative translation factor)